VEQVLFPGQGPGLEGLKAVLCVMTLVFLTHDIFHKSLIIKAVVILAES
jgi:hypothetical protein